MPDLNIPTQVLANVNAKTVKKVGEETLTLFTPATGKKFRLTGAVIASSVEAVVVLLDEGTAIATILVPAKTPVSVFLGDLGVQSAKAGNKLTLTTSVEGAITGTFFGGEDSY